MSILSAISLRNLICCLALLQIVSIGPVAYCQETPAKRPRIDPSKTFTETMRENAEKLAAEQAAESQRMEERSKRLGVLGASTSEDDKKLYDHAFETFRKSLIPIRKAYTKNQLVTEKKVPEAIGREFSQAMHDSFDELVKWRKTTVAIYEKDPENQPGLADLMKDMIVQDGLFDAFEGNLEIAQALFRHDKNLAPKVLDGIGFTAYANGDFELAEAAWTELAKTTKLSDEARVSLLFMPQAKQVWGEELASRKADEERNDNPLVSILTTKGEIVVELFENTAPNTVANFIYLIERDYYRFKTFFRVKQHFCAQAGCERSDGTGNAGYTIIDEMNKPDRRRAFYGSLVMLSAVTENQETRPNTASSQFLFTLIPQPSFDGRFTTFGRIIKGYHVLGGLQRIDLTDEKERKRLEHQPDYIITAKVIRKRNHEYVPTIESGKLLD